MVATPPLALSALKTGDPPVAEFRPSGATPGSGPEPGPNPGLRPTSGEPPLVRDDVVVLVLAAMKPGALLWGWSRVVLRDRPLRHLTGLRFAKALGSGFEGGFGLRPSADRQGLFLVFDGEAAADAFLADSPTLLGYRAHAAELWTAKLRATSSRGSWGGFQIGVSAQAPPQGAAGGPSAGAGTGSAPVTPILGEVSRSCAAPPVGPVAALTRASIRLGKATRFWPLAPPSQVSLESAPGCRLAVGLGEAPLLRQATFSVWDSVAAMDAYARSGAHLAAIKASVQGDFFTESMFTRFVPLQLQGVWKGVRHG